MAEVVFRSTHPDVFAHKTGILSAITAWDANVTEVLADLGFADRNIAMRGQRVIGVEHPRDAAVPDGWRRDKELSDAIVPARRTAAGRRLGERLETLRKPDPRDRLPGGMPSEAFCASPPSLMHPGLAEIGDAIYVMWSGRLSAPDMDRIDFEVWEQIPLSRYWAAREAQDAKAATSDA